MDCFVVQEAGQALLSYVTICGLFAQQALFPSLKHAEQLIKVTNSIEKNWYVFSPACTCIQL